MAAKRIAAPAINWAKIAERVPEAQMPKFLAFRSKSDSYLRRMMASPENPPKIDWAYYKNNVPIAGMVDNFQKQYEAFKVPFPADNVTSLVEAQEQEVKKEVAAFKQESSQRIDGYKKEIDHLRSLLPYEQMTMEDYHDAHPESALTPLTKPTFWPHTPEEQLDYKPSDHNAPTSGH